jgi:hypothetical protein
VSRTTQRHRRSDLRLGLVRRGHSGEGGRPPDGILGHLDAVYALAYLSSGDGDDAEQVVVDAFVALFSESTGKFVCGSCAWRALADHVRLADEQRCLSSAAVRAPFKEGALSQNQSEAIALVLGGRGSPEAAVLLGVSLIVFERDLRSGLEVLHPVMRTIPLSCVADCSDSWRSRVFDTPCRCSSRSVAAT